MKPFKFFNKPKKQSTYAYNPYEELVIAMIRECDRLNISLVGVEESVFNHRIMDIHIYDGWHGVDVDVTYIVDQGGSYLRCGFRMGVIEFATKTSS